ncbi:hypothetical protein ACTFIU_001654 [Dictyostelium citrinum]
MIGGEKRKRIELINLQEILNSRKRNVKKEKVTTVVKKTKSKPTTIKNTKVITTTKSQTKKPVGSKKTNKNSTTKTKPAIPTTTPTNTTPIAPTNTTPTTTSTEKQLIKEVNDCENYNLENDYKINGSAAAIVTKSGENIIFQITPSLRGVVGSVWNRKKVTIGNGFQCEFTFNISHYGADGFAFILQTKGIDEIKRGGGELGYNQMENGVIAIEFDTYYNSDMGDPSFNHISIQRPDSNNRLSTHCQYSLANCRADSINDGVDRNVNIIYKSEEKTISISMNGEIILKDIKIPYSFPKDAYFGFTASTGGEKQSHLIKGCKFKSVLN